MQGVLVLEHKHVGVQGDHGHPLLLVTYEGGQADDAADQPHQHYHAVHPPCGSLKQNIIIMKPSTVLVIHCLGVVVSHNVITLTIF